MLDCCRMHDAGACELQISATAVMARQLHEISRKWWRNAMCFRLLGLQLIATAAVLTDADTGSSRPRNQAINFSEKRRVSVRSSNMRTDGSQGV